MESSIASEETEGSARIAVQAMTGVDSTKPLQGMGTRDVSQQSFLDFFYFSFVVGPSHLGHTSA